MTAELVTVADAAVAAINAAQLSMVATAERHYSPCRDLTAMNVLRVTVVPAGVVIKALSRQQQIHEYVIEIGIQMKPATLDAAGIDPLMAYVQEVSDLFRGKRLSTNAVWVSTENDPVISHEHLQGKRLFTSLLRITFRESR